MKKVFITLALAAITAHAGMFSTLQGITMDEVKPLSAYTLDTNGFNPRVYEFHPVNDPTSLCVIVFSSSDESSAPTMQCYKR